MLADRMEFLENGKYVTIEKFNGEFQIFNLDTVSHDMGMAYLHENGDYIHICTENKKVQKSLIEIAESVFPVSVDTFRNSKEAIFNAVHYDRILVPMELRVTGGM